jgi:TatD DNase family protein
MNPHFFDIHCHLNLTDFGRDWPEVLERTLAGGCWLINVGADLESSRRALEIAKSKDLGVWATVGFHPTEAKDFSAEGWKETVELANDPKCVAIGECGLEYFRIVNSEKLKVKSKQEYLFRKHIELAIELNKPLMIHCRPSENSMDAYEDTLEILSEYKHGAGEKLRGNFHFFAGNESIARQGLALGFTLSFTGVITFADQYNEVIRNAPLDKILAETDAPFVAPVPYRGKRCEPLYVMEVVKKIAELKGISTEEMAQISVQNGRRLFAV